MKDSAAGPRAQNAFSAAVLGRTAACGHGPGPAIVLVENGRLTRGDEVVVGDDLAQEDDQDPAVLGDELDLAADVDGGHRVAGRAEAHAAEPVDLAHDELADGGPQLTAASPSPRAL